MTAFRTAILFLIGLNIALFFWLGHLQAQQRETAAAVNGLAGGVASIQLLTEDVSAPVKAVTAGDEVLPTAAQEGYCWYISVDVRYRPIENAQQSRDSILLNVRSRLDAVDIEAVLVDVHVQVRDEYLLVLPPFPSREDAMVQLKKLLLEGEDAYLLDDGEFQNSVSLGSFATLDAAEAELARHSKREGPVEIRPLQSFVKEPKLQLGIAANAKISPEFWADVWSDYPYLKREKSYCSGVVRPTEFE